jgi:hypothetical protein
MIGKGHLNYILLQCHPVECQCYLYLLHKLRPELSSDWQTAVIFPSFLPPAAASHQTMSSPHVPLVEQTNSFPCSQSAKVKIEIKIKFK